jgi:hypothetical protein
MNKNNKNRDCEINKIARYAKYYREQNSNELKTT